MISLYDLLEAANGQLFGEPRAHVFSEFVLHPADASDSSLFVALGSNARAMDADLRDAVARGATGLLASRPPDFDTDGLTVILVKNPATALMQWSTHLLARLGLPVIAVVGVSGQRWRCTRSRRCWKAGGRCLYPQLMRQGGCQCRSHCLD
jgi:UDP-N-acetylmuramyl pentapeptide synthase